VSTTFKNCYEDGARAEAYAKLEVAGTYALAYRDLPLIIGAPPPGARAFDFGCGAGRSTRFLRRLGFDVVGVDISPEMLGRARALDPQGDYRLIGEGGLAAFERAGFDLALAAFTFDNVPTRDEKVALFGGLGRVLKSSGKIVAVVSSPEIYRHEWASFSTRDFPENARAESGQVVRIVLLDHEDRRPVEDVLWTAESYAEVFRAAGLEVVATHKPLATGDEPYRWVNETRIPPWVIYVLRPAPPGRRAAAPRASRGRHPSSGRRP
jgi:SAM-dependent methyltransferase